MANVIIKKKLPKKIRNNRINEEINSEFVRVIDTITNTNKVISISEALSLARANETDLVEVAKAEVPVCKLIDYDKFNFQQEKAKKKAKHKRMKEITFHPTIAKNDLTYRIDHIKDFLNSGHKVLVVCTFSGRQVEHKEFGRDLFKTILEQTVDIGKLDAPIQEEDRSIKMILSKK